MVIESEQRRRELATLLRARRTAISPAAAGLPDTGRRRTPGLRREEVAALAEISTTLYTWLEQARPVAVSEAALVRVACALRCTQEQTQLVLTLSSGRGPAVDAVAEDAPPDDLDALVHHHDPFPAWVVGPRWEAMTQNSAARRVFGDWSLLPARDRHLLVLMFTDPRYRALFRDWDHQAHLVLAEFRLSTALAPDDPAVDRLVRDSPEFRAWWAEYPALTRPGGATELDHPDLGRLALRYVPMRAQDGSGYRVTFCLPVDGATETALRKMTRP